MRLLLLLLAWLPALAQAVEIYRCEDRQGRQVFSDQPCRVIGALPLPSARDLPPHTVEQAVAPAPEEEEAPLQPPPAASGCPGPSPEALGAALVDAAMREDLNAMAGMYHWPSAGRGASARVFAQARRLSAAGSLVFTVRPAREDDAWLWAGEPPPEAPRLLPPELEISLAERPEAVIARFSLISHAGCFWLPL